MPGDEWLLGFRSSLRVASSYHYIDPPLEPTEILTIPADAWQAWHLDEHAAECR